MGDLVGRRLGRYELDQVVRRRRSATTYRAADRHRVVAVTVLAGPIEPARIADVAAEARAVAALRHPNLVPLIDAGAEDGWVYLVEDYAGPQPTLADRAPGAADPAQAVGLVVPLLAALGHAHEHGVVHRDVTPRHVVLPAPTWPMLGDFAIGRSAHPGGTVVGEPRYLAPEQAFGLPAGPPADVYALTVVLYELLTGRPPFTGRTAEEVLAAHAYEPPPPPRLLRPELSPALEAVLLGGLEKEPSARAGAGELADELWTALGRAGGAAGTSLDRPADPLAARYADGVAAFAAGRWPEAVRLLGEVAEADPTYEDVLDLLHAANDALT